MNRSSFLSIPPSRNPPNSRYKFFLAKYHLRYVHYLRFKTLCPLQGHAPAQEPGKVYDRSFVKLFACRQTLVTREERKETSFFLPSLHSD